MARTRLGANRRHRWRRWGTATAGSPTGCYERPGCAGPAPPRGRARAPAIRTAPGRLRDRYNGGDTTLREGAPMAAVAEHRRLRLDLDCIVRDVRASDLPLLEWFGIYAHLRRMEEANYRDVEAGTKLWLVAGVNGFPVGHVKVNLRVDDPSRGNPRGYIF